MYKTQGYIGEAFKGADRDQVVIAAKSMARITRRCGLLSAVITRVKDYIDIYHLHAPGWAGRYSLSAPGR